MSLGEAAPHRADDTREFVADSAWHVGCCGLGSCALPSWLSCCHSLLAGASTRPTYKGAIQQYLDRRAEWNRPVWVGESGENSDEWYRASFSLLEQHEIGWSFWTWKKLEAGNCPYSVPAPAGWSSIQSFVTDPGKKPSAATAQAALDGLVDSVRLSRNTYNASVVCAILPCR